MTTKVFILALCAVMLMAAVVYAQTSSFPGGTLVRMAPYPHAVLSFHDSLSVISVNQDTWTHITNAGGNLFTVYNSGFTIAGDSITVIYPGDYLLQMSMAFSGKNGEVWHLGVAKNGVIQDYEGRRYTSNNDTGNMSFIAYFDDLVPGDDIKLMIYNDTDGDDPTVKTATVYMRWEFD